MRKFTLLLLLLTIFFSVTASAASDVKPSGTLPIMYVNTNKAESPDVDKDKYINATAYIAIPKGLKGYNAMASADKPDTLQIKGHGNYTYSGFNKKPYRLKFSDKVKPFSMKKSKHFLLMAGADDDLGFLRNILGYEISRKLGLVYTTDAQPVELVLNGDYRGLYFITDKIRVDKNRVNIVEQNDKETDPEKVKGGWLVEIDNYNTDPHIDVNMGGATMWVTYHTPEELSDVQKAYLQGQWDSIATSLYCGDPNDTEWEKHIDMESLAKVYICRELMQDEEGFHGSCYAYKDLTDSKWSFGPVWDFGNAYQSKNFTSYIFTRPLFKNWVDDRAWTFNRFRSKVREIWKDFYNNEYTSLDKYIDSISTVISSAAVSDYNRWKDDGTVHVTNNEASKASEIKGYLHQKAAWLCQQWITPDEPIVTDSVSIYVYPKEGKTPYIFTWGNQSLGGWPGVAMTETTTYNGLTLYTKRIVSGTNIIFSYGGSSSDAQLTQTPDINNVDKDQWYYFYQGSAQEVDKKCGHYNSYDTADELVTTLGINGLKVEKRKDNKRYNLSGQRVNNDYKGIVIENGNKIVER